MQKEYLFFFSFPSVSNFGEAKVTNNRGQNKKNSSFFMPRWSNLSKVTKNRVQNKKDLFFIYGEME